MRIQRLLRLLGVAACAATMLGCRPAPPTTIKVGVFEPLSGANAQGGSLEVEGIRLANGLYPTVIIGGREHPVELIVADNKSDKVEAVNAVTRLIDTDKVVAVLGSWGSSLSMAAGSVVKDRKVPAIGMSCTNPLVTRGNEYYFRVCFIDPFQGTVMARYAVREVRASSAVVVREISNDYSVGLAKYFMDAFRRLTGNEASILAELNYTTGDQDFSSQLDSIQALHPDVVFAPGNYTESALLIREARSRGMLTHFLGGDTWETPQFIQVGGRAVEGAVFSTFFATEVPITSTSTVFLDAYRSRYHTEPVAVSALGFDGYLVLLDALRRAGTTMGPQLRDSLAQTRDFPGAAGLITFDENRDANKSAVIKTVRDGHFAYLTTVQP
ncbi:MAG TPA: ABC transporter substrate-binding protein [Rectinemataceae bacterium]|nr:ABC transporter substrate-binding protein [Rectinemataceae bacterium]